MGFSSLKQLVFASLTAFAAAQAQAQTPGATLQVRGFVDAQYKWQKSQDNSTGAVINDAALYFSHKTLDTELFVDLPFFWSGTTNNFAVGVVKPQAFIAHTIGATKLQLGQFDTIYGLELNDSPDIFFTTQGQLFSRALPLTHTGVVATHGIGPVTLKALAANSVAGKGDSGAQLKGKGEYGATVGYADEMFRASLGYLTGLIVGTDSKSRNFTDVVVGGTFGPLAIDLEYSMEKIADADQGTALAILPIYTVTSELGVGLRFEQLDKIGGGLAGSFEKITQVTGGIQYQANEALKLKADYTNAQYKNPGADTDDNAFALAAVYKF